MEAKLERVLDYKGLKISGHDVQMKLTVQKDYSQPGRPDVSLHMARTGMQYSMGTDAFSIAMDPEDLAQLPLIRFFVQNARGLTTESGSGLNCETSHVTVGPIVVAETGVRWGNFGLTSSHEEALTVLSEIERLVELARALPYPEVPASLTEPSVAVL